MQQSHEGESPQECGRCFVAFLCYGKGMDGILMKMQTKKLVFTALCVAMGLVLPMAFHAVPNAGKIFLPMHIPVFVCGLSLGWPYGLACGILAPLLSSLLTGMPVPAMLPAMLGELAVYGIVSGLLSRFCRTGKQAVDLYVSLVTAMLAGRAVSGVLNALIFSAGSYSWEAFVSASFVTALPGIAIQLVFVPALVLALQKLRLTARPV